MIIRQFRKRITSLTTTPVTSESCAITQIVISVEAVGTTTKLQIQDRTPAGTAPDGGPFVLVSAFTLAIPTDFKPIVMNFSDAVIMNGGIDIITFTGTTGIVDVWISAWLP